MARIKHGVLTPNVAAEVSLGASWPAVDILTRDTTDADVWILVDSAADVAAEADDVDVIPGGVIGSVRLSSPNPSKTVVQLLSSAARKYTVRGA